MDRYLDACSLHTPKVVVDHSSDFSVLGCPKTEAKHLSHSRKHMNSGVAERTAEAREQRHSWNTPEMYRLPYSTQWPNLDERLDIASQDGHHHSEASSIWPILHTCGPRDLVVRISTTGEQPVSVLYLGTW